MSDRCEPPEGLRDKDGWHWIQAPGALQPGVARWEPQGFGSGGWTFAGQWHTNASPAMKGFHYISPVPSPSDLAALVEKSQATATWITAMFAKIGRAPPHFVAELEAALLPFEDIPDAE